MRKLMHSMTFESLGSTYARSDYVGPRGDIYRPFTTFSSTLNRPPTSGMASFTDVCVTTIAASLGESQAYSSGDGIIRRRGSLYIESTDKMNVNEVHQLLALHELSES